MQLLPQGGSGTAQASSDVVRRVCSCQLMVEYAYHKSMQERGTIMKQDRRSTKLSDDDVETLDIPDDVELEEI